MRSPEGVCVADVVMTQGTLPFVLILKDFNNLQIACVYDSARPWLLCTKRVQNLSHFSSLHDCVHASGCKPSAGMRILLFLRRCVRSSLPTSITPGSARKIR